MFWFILILLVSSVISSPVLNRKMIKRINEYPNITWRAVIYDSYKNYTVTDFNGLLNATPTWDGEEIISDDAPNVPIGFVSYHSYRYTARRLKGCAAIQQQILKNGPVSAKISVFADLPAYKRGVYIHREGSLLGAHNVKIVGWGYDNENHYPFWIVNPFWNNEWGIEGFFRIVRGVNECGIEDEVY